MAPLFHVEALLPSSISPKIDSILHSHIYPQVGHVFRAVARFRALLVDVILSKKRTAAARAGGGYGHYGRSTTTSAKRSGGKKRTSKIAGFVKMHFVGFSGPARARDRLDASRAPCYSSYYEYSAAWNAVVPPAAAAAAPAEEEVVEVCDDTAECGYLCWLEEERLSGGTPAGEDDGEASPAVNEIDRLAEKFIARFHAKFLLEKQESYRRYQEMIARSI